MQWDSRCWDSKLLEVDSWFVFIMSFDWSWKTQTLPGFGEVLHWHIWRAGIGDEEPLGWQLHRKMAPYLFFEGLQTAIPFGGLSTAFKVEECFADSLDRQVPTLMLLRKLVAQKRCPRKFPRCFLPQNSGDGLSQKFVAGLGLEIPFQGIPSLVLGPGLLN